MYRGRWKRSHEPPHCEVFVAAVLALCTDHYIFTSCHCYHGKERKSSVYRKLHCSHFPVLPSHLAVAMETSRTSMTALCVRHAGRGDVMCFSSYAMSEASASASLIHSPAWTVAHVEACASAQGTKCHRAGKYLPQVSEGYHE